MDNLATIGHNNPPSEMLILQERLESNYGHMIFEFETLESRIIPLEINSHEEAQSITDFVKAIKVFKAKVESAHKNEKSIYLECGRVVDSWKNGYNSRIDALISSAQAPMTAFLKRKEEEERKRQLEIARKAAEEAAKLEEEARAHADAGINDTAEELKNAAEAKSNLSEKIFAGDYERPAAIRTSNAASAKTVDVWVGEIESIQAIDLDSLRPYIDDEAIQKALNRAVKDGVRTIRGAKIFQKTEVKFR